MSAKKPLLVYDGECGFCGYWVERWRHWTGESVDYTPSQSLRMPFAGVSEKEFESAVKLVMPDGRVFSGAHAVFKTLAMSPRVASGWLLQAYEALPGFAPASEFIYRCIAKNRGIASVISKNLWGHRYEPATYQFTRSLFLRLLGVIYLIAFVSLESQISGLVGRNGILPIGEYLAEIKGRYGYEAVPWLPTLCWLNASDGFLHFLCLGGALLSLLLVTGFAPVLVLFLLWVFYLSLSVAGQTFLNFQWDALLLEAGFLAIFLSPLQWLPNFHREGEPRKIVIWLFRWLLFRLMFMSGVVKLASGDAVWRDGTALQYHYQTQPLPTILGWFAHQLPVSVQYASVLIMYGIELIVPFFIFGPRRLRYAAAIILSAFQALILLTGNYCFFNLLTLLLCLLVLDDAFWPAKWRDVSIRALDWVRLGGSQTPARRWPRGVLVPLAVAVVALSCFPLVRSFRVAEEWPAWMEKFYGHAAPFRSVNGYGLFAVMTTSRPEIVIEGSNDGVEWREYGFKYKPGDLSRPPSWVQPHQPRLDWQMWFAALSGPQRSPWFLHFCLKLLQGSPDVLALLERNPFPGKPPRYLRARVYDYEFTDWTTMSRDGEWWSRHGKGLFCPVMSLDGDRILFLR